MAASNNPAHLEIGGIFNERYEIKRCLKAGGMGAVYEVVQLQTKRPRALKVMLPSVVSNEDLRSRFKLEATIISGVDSEHIADVLDAGVDDATGSPFILMELLKGEELGAMVARTGAMPPEDVAVYLQHAAFGLEKTHEAGIVHRDLKPENLFVTYRDDGSPRVKLLDFGIAKVLGDAKTQHTRGILGTPLYISPEQVHGEQAVSARTDVYALTHIAYTLLVGEAYWHSEVQAAETIMPLLVIIMRGHTEKATERARRIRGVELPPGFDAWFDRGAALKPADRFGGTLALVEAFHEVFGLDGSTRPARKSRITVDVPAVSARTAALPGLEVSQAVEHRTVTTGSTMAHNVVGAPEAKRSNVPWVLAGVAISLVGGYFATRTLGTDEPRVTAASTAEGRTAAPSETAKPAPTEPAGEPPLITPASATPIASAAPSASSAPTASASALQVAGPRTSPPPKSSGAKPPPPPATGGWQPIVPDR